MQLKTNDLEHAVASEVYTFKGYSVFIREDNIIQLEFDEDRFYGEVEDAQNMIAVFRKLNRGVKHALIVIYKEGNMFSKEAREFISRKEISDEVLIADAMVIKGLALRILGNAYLRINRPGRPTCLFTDKEEALIWLKKIIASTKD